MTLYSNGMLQIILTENDSKSYSGLHISVLFCQELTPEIVLILIRI